MLTFFYDPSHLRAWLHLPFEVLVVDEHHPSPLEVDRVGNLAEQQPRHFHVGVGGGGVLIVMYDRSCRVTADPSYPFNAGTKHVGFSPTGHGRIGHNQPIIGYQEFSWEHILQTF